MLSSFIKPGNIYIINDRWINLIIKCDIYNRNVCTCVFVQNKVLSYADIGTYCLTGLAAKELNYLKK